MHSSFRRVSFVKTTTYSECYLLETNPPKMSSLRCVCETQKKLFVQKTGGSVSESRGRSSSTSRQSHWSSLLSVFQTSSPSSSSQSQLQQQHQHQQPTSAASVNDASATKSTTSGSLSSTSRMFMSELNVASHSPESEQSGDVGADNQHHQQNRDNQKQREMRRQRQQADSALDRLDRLVAVDVESPQLPPPPPPPSTRGRHRTATDDEDVGRRLDHNTTPSPLAVVIDGRTRLSNSRQSIGSSSASSTANRSSKSAVDQSTVPQSFVSPPPTASGSRDGAANPPGTPLLDDAVDHNSDRAVFQRRLSRTRRGGTSAGSSNSRSSVTTSSSSRTSSEQRRQTSGTAAGVEGRKLPDVKVVQGQSLRLSSVDCFTVVS